ncbi:nonribosomal peptide synthase [Penicillium odoratum]|uniref:nonribosomal peptide synthase n=1 Tax=Penicillium odoratum TaxID=1167516 RepID=UPI002546D373|nr:nonribosomal peptide synthase [Penicillium odoratum]KAJ5760385.1 nonribosomal peptide synthase [Penicillium odoratum]
MTSNEADIPTGLPMCQWNSARRTDSKQSTILTATELPTEEPVAQQPTVNGGTTTANHVTTKEVTSNERPTAAEFWQNALAGAECSSYPTLPPFLDQPDADREVEHTFLQPSEVLGSISVSTLVRAAWALITGSMTDSNDVMFGTTASKGNTIIPVRVRLGNLSIQEYLREVQQHAIAAIPHEQVGLEQIAKLSTDCEKACAFQTVLIQSRDDIPPYQFNKYGLTIHVKLVGGEINVKAAFDPRVIEPLLVFKLLRRLEFVTQQLSSSSQQKGLSELELLPPQDLDQIREWNSGVPAVVERCIHDIVQERAQADPEAQAVCAWDGELTYRELNELSSYLASHLVNLGVGPEKVVPLCFEKSMWTVVAILSVLKASGTFVLLDPSLPEGRVQSVTQKVQAETAITSKYCQGRLSPFVRQTVVLSKETMDSFKSQSQRSSSQMPKAVPSGAAYIIFTSGSTGEPKGCVVEHRSYCSAASGHGKILGMSKNIRALQFGSYNFAGAIMEMVMTMIYGGCICIPKEEDRTVNLAATIGKLNANWAFLTATVLALLHPEDVPSLRTICVGGEPIRSSQIRLWAPKVQLRQTYGSAETAAVVSSAGLDPASVVTSVGKATTCKCWLTNPANPNQLVPIGAPGEVIFEGPVIGRHYIGNLQKTAEAFIEAPFWRGTLGPVAASSRFYRTGDLASYRSDGSIELLGRKDTQVKLRGQRIELGEIEHQARQSSPDLKEVAVELTVLGGSGPKLISFLVLKSSQTNENGSGVVLDEHVWSVIQTVKSRLESVLPHYMVPSVFLPITSLPLTASGKTDRRILRQMGSALTAQQILDLHPKSKGEKRKPHTRTELQLQQIWCDVLKLDPSTIGLDDSFFQIGGDSVSAMKVISKARALGLNLKMVDIFRKDILVELAQQESLNTADEAPEQVVSAPLVESSLKSALLDELESTFSISSSDVADIYPLTYVQEVLVTAIVSLGYSVDYVYLDLDAGLDVSDLERGCRRLFEKYPILRARFLQLQGKFWQVVPHQLNEVFSIEPVVGNLEECVRNFCLENKKTLPPTQPPAAFFLFRHEKGMRLAFRLSHAQYDAFSVPVLLQAIFDGDQGETPAKPTFPSFLEYTAHRRPKTLAYWSQLLRGSHVTPIMPHIRPKNPQTPIPEQINAVGEAHLPSRLGKITHATLLRAAWAVYLSRMTSETDVIYGQVVAGRVAGIPAVEKIVGCCLNILPERVDFASIKTVAELLNVVQDQYLLLGDSDSLDFRAIVDNCTEWPAGSEFDAVLHHRSVDTTPEIHTSAGLAHLGYLPNPSIFPFIYIVSASRGDDILIKVMANNHMMAPEMCKNMADSLARIIEKLVTGMHMPLPQWMDDVKV